MVVSKSLLRGVLLLSFAAGALAQPRDSVEGVHYQVIEPAVPTASPEDRVEMKEIFWYGCPQCAALEPLMTSWRDGIAGDLDFRRAPAVWNEVMEVHARIYYAAEALNVLDTIHAAVFSAIHEDGNPLSDEAQVREFFARHGVDADEFGMAWNSAEVAAKVDAARIATGDYGVDKLPALIVNGTYRVVQNHAVPDGVEMAVAVNMLVRKVRSQRRIDVGN